MPTASVRRVLAASTANVAVQFSVVRLTGLSAGNEVQVQTVVTWLSGSDVAEARAVLIAAESEFDNAEQELVKAGNLLAKSLMS